MAAVPEPPVKETLTLKYMVVVVEITIAAERDCEIRVVDEETRGRSPPAYTTVLEASEPISQIVLVPVKAAAAVPMVPNSI